MIEVSHLTLKRLRQKAIETLYSSLGQNVRIEWVTRSGGTYNDAWDITEGGTPSDNILDTVAIISGLEEPQLQLLDKSIIDASPALLFLETDINLKNRPNFIIAQKIETEYWKGDGTGASTVWTPDSPPSWTADEWIGFSLWFSDRRFEITDNDTTTLTVDLDGGTLPTSSTEAEIVSIQEWFPSLNAPDLADGMVSPLGDSQLLQSLLITKIPVRGDQI